MDDRGPCAIHPLYRSGDRPGGADIVDWHADHRSVHGSRPHSRDQGDGNRRQVPALAVGVIQDGAPELWNLLRPALLAEPLVTACYEAIDRYHLTERLADVPVRGEDATREPLSVMDGEVRLNQVWFEYDKDVLVLKDVSLVAPPGTTTALVGSSGSGKSTLISLVMAFNHPRAGQVLVDGRDVQLIHLTDYRSYLGVVLQDNFLFDGTVGENISFSKPRATADEIRHVSRIAHCDEFISTFPDGYDTIVGERGVKLSGGQRQRVAIARAVLADPKILILDEATSSLDSESESMIQEGLRALRRGRTTFVIAHRLSTIQTADQILVLEAGEIVERGTHAELLTAGGRYKQLYDTQYRLERDRFINEGEDFTPDLPASAVPASTAEGTGNL